MKLLLFLLIAGHVSTAYSEPKIEGRWKSNKALTIQTFDLPDEISDDVRDRFFNLFGRMIVTYTADEFLTYTPAFDEWEEWTSREKYRVEIETEDQLFIVVTDPDTGESEKYIIHFVSPDRYYVTWDFPRGHFMASAREYFDRLKD